MTKLQRNNSSVRIFVNEVPLDPATGLTLFNSAIKTESNTYLLEQ